MTLDEALRLTPLWAMLGGATLATLFAPFAPAGLTRGAAALGLGGAALAAALTEADGAGATPLFIDDGLARFGAVFAAAVGLGALAFAPRPPPGREAPALVALVALGGAALAGARHGAAIFLGLELMTLPLIALFAYPLSPGALEAGYKYLLSAGAASAAVALGIALAFHESGSLAPADWSAAESGAGLGLGLALILGGLAFKLALPPFHMWAADVFAGAPPAAAALAAALSKGAVAILLVRYAPEAGAAAHAALGALAAAAMLVGNVMALGQPGLARMLAYSSIAHAGFIAAIVASDAPAAGEAVLFYLVAYAPAMLALFAVDVFAGGTARLGTLGGLVRERPATGAAFVVALLTLAGLPVTGGFVAKLYLLSLLASAELWGLFAAAVAGSAVGVAVYGRFMLDALRSKEHDRPPIAPRAGAVALAAAALVMAALGLQPDPIAAIAAAAAG